MKKFICAGAIGLLALCGCTQNMTPYEVGNAASAQKVLISGEATAFKQKVVTRVIEKLGTADWYYRIVGLDTLEQVDSREYGAILILVGFRGGKLDERLLRYLADNPDNPKVVVFFTTGMEAPLPEAARPDLKVDSVSSASIDDRVETRAEQLAALLRRRF
jgi:hypothetical protein